MINSVERAYEVVGERGENMYSFCKANRLPYSTINEHRLNGTQLRLDTIYEICGALSISILDFFAKEGESPHAGQESADSG